MKIVTFPEKELLLRPISSATAADIRSLMHQCYPSVYEHLWEDQGHWYVETTFSESAVLKDLQEKDAPYWLIEWQGEAVGILRLVLDKACPDLAPGLKGLKIHRIYLHPRTHRQGIGRTLMEFILQYAHQLEREIVWLEAMDTQTDALRFYARMGYETTGAFRLRFERMYPELRGMLRMAIKV